MQFETAGFETALCALRNGWCVTRDEWGDGRWLRLVRYKAGFLQIFEYMDTKVHNLHISEGSGKLDRPGQSKINWIPCQADIFAEDWRKRVLGDDEPGDAADSEDHAGDAVPYSTGEGAGLVSDETAPVTGSSYREQAKKKRSKT